MELGAHESTGLDPKGLGGKAFRRCQALETIRCLVDVVAVSGVRGKLFVDGSTEKWVLATTWGESDVDRTHLCVALIRNDGGAEMIAEQLMPKADTEPREIAHQGRFQQTA